MLSLDIIHFIYLFIYFYPERIDLYPQMSSQEIQGVQLQETLSSNSLWLPHTPAGCADEVETCRRCTEVVMEREEEGA